MAFSKFGNAFYEGGDLRYFMFAWPKNVLFFFSFDVVFRCVCVCTKCHNTTVQLNTICHKFDFDLVLKTDKFMKISWYGNCLLSLPCVNVCVCVCSFAFMYSFVYDFMVNLLNVFYCVKLIVVYSKFSCFDSVILLLFFLILFNALRASIHFLNHSFLCHCR